jgi:hypothetical protein
MRLVVWVVVLLATLSACEPAPETRPTPDTTNQPAAVVATQSRFYPAKHLYELPDSTRSKAELHQERALGIVVPLYGDSAPREITVVNDTAHEVQTIARVRFYSRPEGGWTDTLWTRERGLSYELMRATHDDYGLPVVAKNGEWLRVAYAFAADGSPRMGWIRLAAGRTVYHDRDQQMNEFSTDLADPRATEFFASPGGQRVQVDLRPSHMLEVLRINGDWIQVALLRPDTTPCTGDPQLKVQRGDTVWVRRFNAQGKRQLLSAVAGC